MVPVLLVARICYGKKGSIREWAAAATITLGCVTYLTTQHGGSSTASERTSELYEGIMGAGSLLLYLFFDGLTSTSQEKYFGRSESSSDPFGPESSVLPQMIFVNLFTSLFSFVGLGLDFYRGALVPSLTLLTTNHNLQVDVLALSATAAFGLIILLNTIASFGALTCALLMTVRQFFSILLNAGVFRHVGTVGIQGWCGVGWVASGVWIKTNRAWDEKPKPKVALDPDAELLLPEKDETASRSSSPDNSPILPAYTSFKSPLLDNTPTPTSQARRYLLQFVVPLLTPLLFASLLQFFMPEMTASVSHPETTSFAAVEGGSWENQLHDALTPQCNLTEAVRWPGNRRTALASNPRSGNTFVRELVERSTNWQSSTVSYCDQSLAKVFHGECDHEANFLVKTHYPDQLSYDDPDYLLDYHFDQVVHLVRNPIDSIYSGWQLGHVPKTADGSLDHAGRLNVQDLGATAAQREDLLSRAEIWAHHTAYWSANPLPTHQILYEDLLTSRLPSLLSLISFLLPPTALPDLSQVACALENDETKEAYKSRKSPAFASWDLWNANVRTEVIEMVKESWCEFGYDRLLREAKGTDTGVDNLCD